MDLTTANMISIPASILALIGIGTVLIMIGRKDKTLEDHSKALKEHGDALRNCQEQHYVSAVQCHETQAACVDQQREANTKIISDIKEVKDEIRRNRTELKAEAESERQQVHDILRELTKAVGRIEGVVGRFRFNQNGDVR
jgi:gas vesicle protein